VVGLIFGQERLQRPEEQPRRRHDARPAQAGLAHGAAHLLQQEVATGHVGAAQQGTFELGDQQSPFCRRQLQQISPKTLDRGPARGHRAYRASPNIIEGRLIAWRR
jgi:hypothetical protein